MSSDADVSRRGAIAALGTLAAAFALPFEQRAAAGRLKLSVSRWCYGRIPLDDLCEAAKGFGYRAIDLLDPPDFEVPKKHGITCAMANGFGRIPVGFNRPDNHDKLVADGET